MDFILSSKKVKIKDYLGVCPNLYTVNILKRTRLFTKSRYRWKGEL